LDAPSRSPVTPLNCRLNIPFKKSVIANAKRKKQYPGYSKHTQITIAAIGEIIRACYLRFL
jgi:hypothetical protein